MLSVEELHDTLAKTVEVLDELRSDLAEIVNGARAVPEDMAPYSLLAAKLDALHELLAGKTWQAGTASENTESLATTEEAAATDDATAVGADE